MKRNFRYTFILMSTILVSMAFALSGCGKSSNADSEKGDEDKAEVEAVYEEESYDIAGAEGDDANDEDIVYIDNEE